MMQNESSLNVHTGRSPVRTFVIFGIVLLLSIGATWWITRSAYGNTRINDKTFSKLDSNLNDASNFLLRSCMGDSEYINTKSKEPGLIKIRTFWKPKADSVLYLTRKINRYIESIKRDVVSSQTIHSSFAETGSIYLYDSLKNFYSSLLNLFPENQRTHISTQLSVDYILQNFTNAEGWSKNYFSRLSASGTSCIISSLQFKTWAAANQMMKGIESQWCDLLFDGTNTYRPLVSQNSMYFLPGQTLEIQAGLGKYSDDVKPVITIDGQMQALNADGLTDYKKIITKGGNGFIPITITFTNPFNGEVTTVNQTNGYTVLSSK